MTRYRSAGAAVVEVVDVVDVVLVVEVVLVVDVVEVVLVVVSGSVVDVVVVGSATVLLVVGPPTPVSIVVVVAGSVVVVDASVVVDEELDGGNAPAFGTVLSTLGTVAGSVVTGGHSAADARSALMTSTDVAPSARSRNSAVRPDMPRRVAMIAPTPTTSTPKATSTKVLVLLPVTGSSGHIARSPRPSPVRAGTLRAELHK
jgi:hypothetical protein